MYHEIQEFCHQYDQPPATTTTSSSPNNNSTAHLTTVDKQQLSLIQEITRPYPSPPLSNGQQSPAVRNLTPFFEQDPASQLQQLHQMDQQYNHQQDISLTLPSMNQEYLHSYPGSSLNPITLDEQQQQQQQSQNGGNSCGEELEHAPLFPDCLDLNPELNHLEWMEFPLNITPTSQY